MRFGYYILWVPFHWIFRIIFRTRVYHADRIPHNGPALLASNHASFMDPPLIGAFINREICYLARNTLFRFPVFGSLLHYINVIPVDRDGRSPKGLKAIASKLQEGHAVILFPEGTRCADGKMIPAKSGVGLLAIKSDAPIVPIRVFGTFEAYGRHLKWPRPKPLAVKYGKPLYLQELRQESKTASKDRLKKIYQEAADAIMASIEALEPHLDCDHFG